MHSSLVGGGCSVHNYVFYLEKNKKLSNRSLFLIFFLCVLVYGFFQSFNGLQMKKPTTLSYIFLVKNVSTLSVSCCCFWPLRDQSGFSGWFQPAFSLARPHVIQDYATLSKTDYNSLFNKKKNDVLLIDYFYGDQLITWLIAVRFRT